MADFDSRVPYTEKGTVSRNIEPMNDVGFHIGKIDSRTLDALSGHGVSFKNSKDENGKGFVELNSTSKFKNTIQTDNGPITDIGREGVKIDHNTSKLESFELKGDNYLNPAPLRMKSINKDGTTDYITFFPDSIDKKSDIQGQITTFRRQAPSFVQLGEVSSTKIELTTSAPAISRGSMKAFDTSFDATLGKITLETKPNDPFTKMEWIEKSLDSLGLNNNQLGKLKLARFGINSPRAIANIESKNDKSILIPTTDGSGFATICPGGEVHIYDKDNPIPSGGIARKPVIYLYPTKKTEISVSVKLSDATMIAEYPKTQGGTWNVEATPRGNLTDITTNKKYSYLFWEAEKHSGFQINTSNAHCIASSGITTYLEKSLKTLGLNAREANDFMVYWLPVLEKNPYSLIEWKTTEYTDMAKLNISPKPDSLIRVFMVFQKSESKIKTGNPKLEKSRRNGYSVIEWGGCNMDEGNNIK